MSLASVNMPKSGATLRVWEIADAMTRDAGQIARRKDVIARVVAEGGNANTASTQYHYWKTAVEQGERLVDTAGPTGAVIRLTVGPGGVLHLPDGVLAAAGLREGDVVIATPGEDGLTLTAARAALDRAKALVRSFDARTGSPTDELLDERRAEAGRG